MSALPTAMQIVCNAAGVRTPSSLPDYLQTRARESLEPLLADPRVDSEDPYVLDTARRIVLEWRWHGVLARLEEAMARLEASPAPPPSQPMPSLGMASSLVRKASEAQPGKASFFAYGIADLAGRTAVQPKTRHSIRASPKPPPSDSNAIGRGADPDRQD